MQDLITGPFLFVEETVFAQAYLDFTQVSAAPQVDEFEPLILFQ
jgi:hypothetical protein